MPQKDPEEYRRYMNEYMKKRWAKRRGEAIEYLGGKCKVCRTTENLEIDHIDPKTKIKTVAKMSSASEEKFWAEVDKCQLLCHQHHLEKSIMNGELSKGGGSNRIDDYGHGTGHMYYKDKCRCDQCKEWKRLYRKQSVTYGGQLR